MHKDFIFNSNFCFQATMALPESHKGGKLHAYQLLCKMTVQREHDTPLEPEHLAQFYATLHDGLHSTDAVSVNIYHLKHVK